MLPLAGESSNPLPPDLHLLGDPPAAAAAGLPPRCSLRQPVPPPAAYSCSLGPIHAGDKPCCAHAPTPLPRRQLRPACRAPDRASRPTTVLRWVCLFMPTTHRPMCTPCHVECFLTTAFAARTIPVGAPPPPLPGVHMNVVKWTSSRLQTAELAPAVVQHRCLQTTTSRLMSVSPLSGTAFRPVHQPPQQMHQQTVSSQESCDCTRVSPSGRKKAGSLFRWGLRGGGGVRYVPPHGACYPITSNSIGIKVSEPAVGVKPYLF